MEPSSLGSSIQGVENLLPLVADAAQRLIPLINPEDGSLGAVVAFSHLENLGGVPALRGAVAALPELALFKETMWSVGSRASGQSHDNLVRWLVVRGAIVSPKQAVHELQVYLAAPTFPVTLTVALAGISVDRVWTLGGGISLIPYDAEDFLRDSEYDYVPQRDSDRWEATRYIRAALVKEVQHRKIYTPLGSVTPEPSAPTIMQDALRLMEQARLCIGLIRPCASMTVGDRQTMPPSVPCGREGGGASWRTTLEPPDLVYLGAEECEAARAVHDQFLALPQPIQASLMVPIQRLDGTLSGYRTDVDRAIDLGIALESLFLRDDEQAELTYKLSLRGARLLGKTLTERSEIQAFLQGIYQLRSTAVHRGVLPSKLRKLKGMAVVEALNHAVGFTARAIRAVIARGGVDDWDLIVLAD